MVCPRCDAKISPDAMFCAQCGARLGLTCPQCGAPGAPGAKFCTRCGSSLAPEPKLDAAGMVYASPETYTPKHLAERIIAYKGALEGERKLVTVLFADLKGSMELLAERDPEEARAFLDPVLEMMMAAVHRFEGTVNQVLGDGIMALFGAPLAHEDHAVRACYAALAMQSAVRRYADTVRQSRGVEVQIRVGLNSGEVVVRFIGNDLRMDYTAVGQTTHLAARIEQLAPAGTIRVTADTLRLTEGLVQAHSLGSVPVRGLPEPVEIFELVGVAPIRRRLRGAARGGPTPLVDREHELEVLEQTVEQAAAGRGQVVALVGDPGVGKSRLVWELIHSPHIHGWLLLEGRSFSYGKATPYLPVIDLLKAYFQIEDRDDVQRIREKVATRALALDESLAPMLPALLAVLEVPVDDPQWEELDAAKRRSRILDSCRRVIVRESQRQPVLVVAEDLQWADSETQVFLDALVGSLPRARILLLVTYRLEHRHGWASRSHYTELPITALAPDRAEALLEVLLGTDVSLRPPKQLLIQRAEGNPFFLEESVWALVETGTLAGEPGAYRAVRAPSKIQIPATVQAVLAARIDRLPPDEKRLLQSAAVLGTEVPFPLLQAIAELPEERLRRCLTQLQAAGFLSETSLFPELTYTFKHALTHEVAYGSLVRDRRTALHAAIMHAIEVLHAHRLAEHVERLAYHAFHGEIWDRALTYFRRAGDKAAWRSANREAVACFEQALSALPHLPESRDRLKQAVDLRLALRNSLWPLGEIARLAEALREAGALAETLGDPRRQGYVSTYMSHYFWTVGENERAMAAGERALEIARARSDLDLEVEANYYLGIVSLALGDHFRAADILRATVQALDRSHLRVRFAVVVLPVLSRAYLARCLAELGEFTEATACGHEGMRIAQETDYSFGVVAAHFGLGSVYLRQGAFEKAIAVLGRGLDLCQAGGIRNWIPSISASLGSACVFSGRVEEGLALLERAVERADSMKVIASSSLWVTYLGQGYLVAGRRAEAAQSARQALSLAQDHKERGYQAWALLLLGDIAAQSQPPAVDAAGKSYREALSLAERLGMRPLVARCHRALGLLYERTGDAPRSGAHLATADTLLRQLGIPSQSDPPEV